MDLEYRLYPNQVYYGYGKIQLLPALLSGYKKVMVLSGGLIGPQIDESNYTGGFAGTEIFIGCSDSDFHIPLQRLLDSAVPAAKKGAKANKRICPGMDHSINEDELEKARSMTVT